MKGLILAGGSGSRLYPMTRVVSKQLLPVFDKPMIYYPLTTLMLAGIREILVISTPHDLPLYQELLGDGTQWGVSLQFAPQKAPTGLPDAFVVGRGFLDGSASALILGDNIFYGHRLGEILVTAAKTRVGARVFGYRVHDPERYGVVEFDGRGNVVSIEEKPKRPKAPYAITGLYFLDGEAADIAARLEPSARGETEMIDLLRAYQQRGQLQVELLGRGIAWLDTGTPEALQAASSYIEAIESRQGLKVACPEEVAYRLGFIEAQQLMRLVHDASGSVYGAYLAGILEEETSRPEVGARGLPT